MSCLTGGPGGSGVGQILKAGFNFRTVLSAEPNADPDTARVGMLRTCGSDVSDLI